MAAEAFPASAAAGGTLFGATLWLVADETVVPALGLSAPPSEYPLRTHVQALASHLVYGVTTDAVRRTVRRVLQAEKETGGPEATRQ
jgi:putative membrane protein